MERADHRDAELPEASAAVVLRYQIDDVRVGVAHMHANGQVQAADLFVKRIEIRIGDEPVPLDPAHEDAAGALLLAKLQLLERRAHIEQRQDADPAQPPLALSMYVGEPAIIAFTDGDFPFGLVGNLLDEDGRIEHLNIDAQLVHVPDAGRHVFHLAGFARRVHHAARAFRDIGELPGGHDDADQAADLAVDKPELLAALALRSDDDGTIFLIGPVHEVPGMFGLDDVGIGIDGRHGSTPPPLNHAGSACLRVELINRSALLELPDKA